MNRKIAVFMVLSFVFLLSTQVFASPLDEELQKLKQAGIPTTTEELNLPEIPDSENGALVYKEAFKLVDNLVQKYHEEWNYMPYNGIVAGGWEKTPEEWKEKIIDLIIHNPEFAKVYQLLEKASSMKCRFYKEGVDALNSYAQLRTVARMLAEKAKIEADYGDFNKSLTASLTGLKAAKSLSNEPSVVAQLTRMAIDSIALGELQKNINKKEAEPGLYLLLVKEMEAERRQNISHFGLRGEYLEFWIPVSSNFRKLAGKSFEFTDEDKKELEEKFLFPPEDKTADRMIENEKKLREFYKEIYLKSGCKNVDDFLKEQELFFLKNLTKALLFFQKPYWETREELKNIAVEIEKASKGKAFLTYNIPFASLARTYLQEARSDALFGAAELGLANRIYRQKHGKFADSLNQLTPEILPSIPLDPFTGKDYIYRIKNKGFIVYSVADNLKDDGGIPQFSEQGKKGDFDIVWEDDGAGTILQSQNQSLPEEISQYYQKRNFVASFSTSNEQYALLGYDRSKALPSEGVENDRLKKIFQLVSELQVYELLDIDPGISPLKGQTAETTRDGIFEIYKTNRADGKVLVTLFYYPFKPTAKITLISQYEEHNIDKIPSFDQTPELFRPTFSFPEQHVHIWKNINGKWMKEKAEYLLI